MCLPRASARNRQPPPTSSTEAPAEISVVARDDFCPPIRRRVMGARVEYLRHCHAVSQAYYLVHTSAKFARSVYRRPVFATV
jgi:hypothetical protein